ncbi:SGNH/GDSL hydrolase family protein [Paenibacillus sp. GCM10027626]|uniref:SGNH/GDSL hydrolase family protein n=1 Tax=Paenibacillus sp. GCM10027626 TaxID=3273411 RepID=UPI0036402172
MKIAGFGDSITAGLFVAAEDAYLSRLAVQWAAEAVNAGVPGNTSAQGLSRFERDVLDRRPDVCVVAFGMNDHTAVAANTAKVQLPAFERNLALICGKLLAVRIVPVLCTIHPILEGDGEHYYYSRHPREWYVRPAGAQAWIDAYNEAVRRVAGSVGAALADVARCWERYVERGGEVADLLRTRANSGSDDGVHPTAEGHRLYATCIGEAMRNQILKGEGK